MKNKNKIEPKTLNKIENDNENLKTTTKKTIVHNYTCRNQRKVNFAFPLKKK